MVFNQSRRVWYEAPERSNKKGGKGRRIKLLNMATDRLKDSVTAALVRPFGEKRSHPLPEFLEDHHVGEFCAEQRGDRKWEKKPGQVRNESLDLSVQALAVVEYKGLLRINPSRPPNWAIVGDTNPYLVANEADQVPGKPKPKKRSRRRGRMKI